MIDLIFELLVAFKYSPLPSPYVWFGLILGVILAFIIIWLRKNIQIALSQLVDSLKKFREYFSTDPELQLKNEIFVFAQKQHLASSMFALDEIAIEPKVLTPYLLPSNYYNYLPTDSVSLAVPYIPDWPELGAVYNASTMPIIDALQGNANIILAGHAGSGKTFALAWLTSKIIKKSIGLGKLSDLLPLYLHATDIPGIINPSTSSKKLVENQLSNGQVEKPRKVDIKVDANQVIELLLEAINNYTTSITKARLPHLVKNAIQNQRAIFIIDKVDELTPGQSRQVTEYLRVLVAKYPRLRVIVAISFDNFAKLPELSFNLLALASWNDIDRTSLVDKWLAQWAKNITTGEKTKNKKANSYYLRSWLSTNNLLLNPFEFTLKIWASLNGDSIGSDGPSLIESFVRRQTKDNSSLRTAGEQFALQQLCEMYLKTNIGKPKYSTPDQIEQAQLLSNDDDIIETSTSTRKQEFKTTPTSVDSLVNAGLLTGSSDGSYSFIHPIIFGYLAGKALANSDAIKLVQKQDSWSGRNLALYYLARFGDVTSLIQSFLQDDDQLHNNHLLISRWLQVAPKNRSWRTIVLRTLASTLQKERDSLCLAAKTLTAMALSGDSGVSVYFRQLIKSNYSNLKQLGALGCGITRDENSVEDLTSLLQEQSPASIRAASLALASIGTKQSLELLANNLLNGDETTRRYAAEALANDRKEGHPSLKDGSSMEDLLVRRSVIYGLIRINQPWANKIVENLQLEDNEWVVRNAAIQVFDELNKKNSMAPSRLPELTESQWLINYATRQKTSVAPGQPAIDLVNKALTSGTDDEKINALEYYRNNCNCKSIEIIYSLYKNNIDEIRDAAYHILWIMTLSGSQLPI